MLTQPLAHLWQVGSAPECIGISALPPPPCYLAVNFTELKSLLKKIKTLAILVVIFQFIKKKQGQIQHEDHTARIPSPLPLHIAKTGRNNLNEEFTPLLPTGIGERFLPNLIN
jgi:hypothetical protein